MTGAWVGWSDGAASSWPAHPVPSSPAHTASIEAAPTTMALMPFSHPLAPIPRLAPVPSLRPRETRWKRTANSALSWGGARGAADPATAVWVWCQMGRLLHKSDDAGITPSVPVSRKEPPMSSARLRRFTKGDEIGYFEPRTWAFWRSLIVVLCVFSIVGHWLEIPYCVFMDRCFGIVTDDYNVWTRPAGPPLSGLRHRGRGHDLGVRAL